MNGFARVWGAILPLRWYLQVLFDQAARGAPPCGFRQAVHGSGRPRLPLFFPGLAAAPRDRHIRRARRPALSIPPVQYGRGVAIAFRNEAIRILSDRSVLGLIVLAPILYGLLYPQPYLGEVLRSLPIAVVDQDHTELSRDFVQALNADQALAVTARANTLGGGAGGAGQARRLCDRRHPQGHRAAGAAGRTGAHRRLRRRRLSPALQPDPAGHIGGCGDRVRRRRASRRAHRRQSRLRGAGQKLSGRVRVRTAVQSDRRLCGLCRAGRLRADPAADAAAWRRVDRRGGVRARRTREPSAAGGRARRLRPGARPSLLRNSGPRALSDRPAARVRLFDARTP